MHEDEDEGGFGGLYENGHWVWDENIQGLQFVSDSPPSHVETVQMSSRAPTGAIEFRDDIDLIEQLRYRRRYQRKLKPGQADVVTLQDVKDIALYTAPISILSPILINMLHLPTTERFLRALTFCCAYYLQVSDEMDSRIMMLETKVRTPDCDILENEFKQNLSDLRILVAKEYCIMLIGGGDMKRFHHMGPNKKRQSLSEKDARLFETFVRVCVQIVYVALGRKCYHQIELETHRILKSEIFNSAKHTLKSGFIDNMRQEQKNVLMGPCLHHDKKLNTRSPLMNEVFCHRPIDFRLMGLGVIKFENLSRRLHYLYLIVAAAEEKLSKHKITVGIIGMKRTFFDTMLKPITHTPAEGKSKASVSSTLSSRLPSKKSAQVLQRFYPEIQLPPKDSEYQLPLHFPEAVEDLRPVSEVQRRRWQKRFLRLTKPVPVS